MPKLDLTRAINIKGIDGEIKSLKGPGFSWSKPVVFDPDYAAVNLYASSRNDVLPDVSNQERLNTLVQDLKSANAWNLLHWLHIYRSSGDSDYGTINYRNPGTFDAVKSNSPIYTLNRGFKGDGIAASLDIPDYDLSVYPVLNNFGIGAWVLTPPANGQDAIMGSMGNNLIFRANLHSSQFNSSKIQQSNASFDIDGLATNGSGLMYLSRTATDSGYMAVNNVINAYSLYSPSQLDGNYIRLFYRFNVYSDIELAISFGGESLHAVWPGFYAALNKYMNSF